MIREIVQTCSSGTAIPSFCKIRVFESIEKTVEYAKIFEEAGASLLAVHGRIREQKGSNTGVASWDHNKAIKQALSIPVVANGDLIYHENIDCCHKYTGCDGVMTAEPHLFSPAIFTDNRISSARAFKDYLSILGGIERCDDPEKLYIPGMKYHISLGAIKSDAFKIFNSVFKMCSEKCELLDICKKLSDHHKFIEDISNNLELCQEDFEMHPYIRQHAQAGG